MSETKTRLETIILDVFNKKTGNYEKVRCFLDNGSNRSFVTKSCAERCGFHKFSNTSMYISVFGNSAKKYSLDVAKAEFIKNINHPKDKLRINLFIMDDILSEINSHDLSPRQSDYIEKNNIELADPEAACNGKLKVDILLGQDCVRSITSGENLVLPGGSILVPTWDKRYILAGPLDSESKSTEPFSPFLQPRFIAVNAVVEPFPHYVKNKMPRKLKKMMNRVFTCISSEEELEIIDSFRNLEALGIHPLDYEISPILDDFDKTTTYDGKRYTVRLPFKDPQIKKLSNNFLQAFQRLMSGYKRRLKPKFLEESEKYKQSFLEDLEKGILEKVEKLGTVTEVYEKLSQNPQFFNQLSLVNNKACCYLPHQAVYKASTGKFRRVHDGKAKPFKGAYSLNECLEKGPDLMSHILYILIGFRKHQWAASADIEKAFPQIVIHPDDRDALRCLWLENDEVWIYRFARLPFGLNCSPMILAATLQKHLSEMGVDEKTKQDFIASIYVDDSVWSEKYVEDLYKRKDFYTKIFQQAGMNFREWTSNHPQARKLFGDLENRDPPAVEKILGLRWQVKSDTLHINSDRMKHIKSKKLKTKRDLWRLVPSIYDILGLLSPYVVVGKMIISEACERVKGWDCNLPVDIIQKAKKWASELEEVSDIMWPRHIGIPNAKHVQLVGCADASSKALAACVYLLSTDVNGKVTSNLVFSRTRVAPKLKHSIPRMELLAAVLLTNIMNHVRIAYKEIPDKDIFWFTDSANVIFWLYSGHYSWRPFVANQLKKIKRHSLVHNWIHIDTKQNPADLPSRGTTLKELKNNTFWMHGPQFWKEDLFFGGQSVVKGFDKHYNDLKLSKNCALEIKSGFKKEIKLAGGTLYKNEGKADNVEEISESIFSLPENSNSPLEARIDKIINIKNLRMNDYDHLMRLTNTILEAASAALKGIKNRPLSKVISNENLSLISTRSEILWIQATQKQYFPEIFKLIKDPKTMVSSSSRSLFIKHAIFLDPELKVLRCRTRNENSLLAYSSVYPILLPSMVKTNNNTWEMCDFTSLLVKKAHKHIGHQGVPHTLSHLRSEFWILQGRRFVQKILNKCVICRKIQGKFYSVPPMPSLPEFRVVRHRPFFGTGLDFLGHFWCKNKPGSKYKTWLIQFTCGSTRAIHLEAVKSRGIVDFINAVSRFMNTRGIPTSFISDHEKCFVRLSEEFDQIAKSKRVHRFFEERSISWNFYTEKSPNKGGFIERNNETIKRTLYKVLGKKLVDFEEFRTLATYCTSVINDRPLTYLYSDIDSEYKALSPSMLLCGYNLNEPPHLNLHKPEDDEEIKLSERYFYLEKIRNSFWNIWHKQYLRDLFERHVRQKKSQKEPVVPKIGDIVLIDEEKLPRKQWRMAKVIDIDIKRGSVRQCTVQVLSPKGNLITKLKRSPHQLIPLEVNSREEKFDADKLIPFEGDPRQAIPWSSKPSRLQGVKEKYSQIYLNKLKKAKVWPPYKPSKQFLDPVSINTGPLPEFVSKTNSPRQMNLRSRKVQFDI